MRRNFLPLLTVFLLLVCMIVEAEAQAPAPAPYFYYCMVRTFNISGKTKNQIIAQIYSAGPNITIPTDIKSVTVSGPSGFRTTSMTSRNYTSGVFNTMVSGPLPAGQYKFTVLDTKGDSVNSYYYRNNVNTVPAVDKSSLRAFGAMTAPTLSWSDLAGYNGRVLFQAAVYDKQNNQVWSSDLTPETCVTVPSGKLVSGQSYRWGVFALDSSWGMVTDNMSLSNQIPLKAVVAPGFKSARVYSLTSGGTTSTVLDAEVAIPSGTLPSAISSLVVTDANKTVVYSFQPSDYNQAGGNFTHTVSGTLPDGLYTFTATDTAGHKAASCHYFKSATIPQADPTSLQASGSISSGPLLSWTAPNPGTGRNPLFYSVTITNASSGAYVWGTQGLTNTACEVPAKTLSSSTSYKWQLDVQDSRSPYNPNNISRSSKVDLVIDNSRPNFLWGATAYIDHGPGGIFPAFDSYFYNPAGGGLSSTISLSAAGPTGSGVAYTFGAADLISPWPYEYFHQTSGSLPDGPCTFTISYPAGQSRASLLTHDVLVNSSPIPLPDETTFQVTGSNPLSPIVSWSGIQGFPGHLYYAVTVRDSNENTVYSSSADTATALQIPGGYLHSGKSYTYRVEAFDDPDWMVYTNRSESAWYPLALEKVSVPGAPGNVSALPGNGQASVSFSIPANGGGTITGYTVTSSPGSKTGTGTSSPIPVTGLTNGATYKFSVTATNSMGAGPPSAYSTPVTVGAPGRPTDVTATPGATSGSIVVHFTKPDSNGSDIISCTVTSTPGSKSGTAASSPITVTGLKKGTVYTFTVAAKNKYGTGPTSSPASCKCP